MSVLFGISVLTSAVGEPVWHNCSDYMQFLSSAYKDLKGSSPIYFSMITLIHSFLLHLYLLLLVISFYVRVVNPIWTGVFWLTMSIKGGLAGPPHLKFLNFFSAPLKSKFLGIYFIGLKWSLDIFRKSQEASAFNFGHKGHTPWFSVRRGLRGRY